jgi:adenine-specific DNA-methyltransferase
MLEPTELRFEYSKHEGKVSTIEPFVGQAGILSLTFLTVEALDQAEDYLIFTGVTDQGETLPEEVIGRFFSLPGKGTQPGTFSLEHPLLEQQAEERKEAIRRQISQRNAEFFEVEVDKLDAWAEDLKVGLEREIKEFDRQIKEVRKAAVAALTLEEKLAGQKQIKALETERGKRRRALFDAQDQIDQRRDQIIEEIEGKLQQKVSSQQIFSVRWQVR